MKPYALVIMAEDAARSGPDIPPQLQSLRDRIDAVDHQFLELLAQRHALVTEVASVKRTSGVPIQDANRETNLLMDRCAHASKKGLSPDVTESLFRLVLWASRNRQAELLAAVPTDMPTARIAVIGASGGMGRLLCQLFRGLGNEILEVDQDTRLTIKEAATAADVTVISVGIRDTLDVIALAGPHVPEHGLITDVTSTKQAPVSAMLQHSVASVIGTHPLFGPDVHSMQGQRIAITPGRLHASHDWLSWMRGMFSAAGMILLETTSEEHDRVMAIVQVLTHFSTEVIGHALKALDVSIEETLRFTSPIYHMELLMTARHFAQSADLYSAIQMANPNTEEVISAFRNAADACSKMVSDRDDAAFRKAFEEVRDYFGPFAEQAMQESSHLIDRLVERGRI